MTSRSSPSAYRALGYRFQVTVEGMEDDSLVRALDWALQGLRGENEKHPEHTYRITRVGPNLVRLERDGTAVLAKHVGDRTVMSVLVTDLNERAVASKPDQPAFHAGALSILGRGVLLPAKSGSGKTTLTAALVTAGCDYLTDEAASINLDSLMIEPYPKPLSLSPASLAALNCPPHERGSTELFPASWLRPDCWSGPVPSRLIVFPSFRDGAPPDLRAVSRGEALVELANNSFNFVDHGGEWLPALRGIVAGCDCFHLTFGSAVEAAAVIMERLD